MIATGLVVDAALVCDPEARRVVATVVPTRFIRRVGIEGQDIFRKRDIIKRVFLRSGTPLAVEPDSSDEAIEADPDIARQIDSLLRLYRQRGLDDVRITVRLTAVSLTRVDVDFVIHEGAARRIDSLEVRHEQRGGPIRLCPTIAPSKLERLVGLGAGDLVTSTTERQIQTRLKKIFQAQGFERPDVEIQFPDAPPDEPQILEVRVVTTKCWLVRVWQRALPGEVEADQLAFRWLDPLAVDELSSLDRGVAGYTLDPVGAWEATLPFGESGSFDRSEASRALDAMTREMRARGFPFAEIRLVFRDRPSDGDDDVRGRIDYLITTNLQRRIEEVELRGVKAFPVEVVRALMKTQPYGFFSGSGVFDEARVLADLGAIAEYYRDEGYFQLRFADAVDDGLERFSRQTLKRTPSGAPIVWRYAVGHRGYQVEKPVGQRDLKVVINIVEGPQSKVSAVEIQGFDVLDAAEAAKLIGVVVGGPMRPRGVDDAVARLERTYRKRGHYRFQLNVSCRQEGAPLEEGDDCRAASLAASERVVVRFEAVEGPPMRIGAVVWRGQSSTDPHVLTRDLPKAGDLLDVDRVNQGLRLMRGLPIFNAVRVDVVGVGTRGDDPARVLPEYAEPETADLVVAVEESQTRFLDVAAGLRSIQRANIGRIPRWAANGTGLLVDQVDRLQGGFGRPFALDLPDILLTLELEYMDLNAGGRGEQLRVPFIAGFSLSEFLRLASFNPSYSWRRFLDTRMTLTVRAIAELDRVTDPLDRLELGAEADLLLPIGTGMLAGFSARGGVIRLTVPGAPCVNCLTAPAFGYGTALPQTVSELTTDEALCPGGIDDPACAATNFRPQFSVSARWRYSTLDTPLHPTRGFMLTAATSFILDRDRFALEPRFNQFVKWEASARGAISIGDIVVAAFIRYGGSLTFSQDFLPADERFTLGGFNGLRGFSDNGICRYDAAGKLEASCPGEFGGNVIINGSTEIRAPILKELGIWFGAFIDFGALARSHETLYLNSFRMSGGVGLRWLLGGIIPVRLDVGVPFLGRRCISYTEDGECVLEAPSNVHVDLLYPF